MTKKICWSLLCAGCVSLSAMAASEGDAWTGHYRMTSDMTFFAIAQAPDADPAELTEAELESGLARWTLSIAGVKDSFTLRRFRPRDYDEINVAGDIECVEGGFIFFCQVTPGAMVDLGSGGKKVAPTGFLGLSIPGRFEFIKLDSTP